MSFSCENLTKIIVSSFQIILSLHTYIYSVIRHLLVSEEIPTFQVGIDTIFLSVTIIFYPPDHHLSSWGEYKQENLFYKERRDWWKILLIIQVDKFSKNFSS